ncbi:DUF1365 domain-containing protein [Aquabacterium sp. A7-Y]|uniref:DUF1365 domain-containing protein n=1 Tax=Aquabacterium sp. A7-Y TaxID=1349605 RepID=UPI00223D1B2D|nr:DUF1365 domain-containing protein [Aquabacterium sp. A7-Y]MCW7536647.1 DUF1365 domain-containing protein [Aquabacterium sp. A7-Y]
MRPVAQIGFGQVRHTRLRPVRHTFAYPGYFLLLPMRGLRERPEPVLRRNGFGALSFHDADHGDGSSDCLLWLEALLARAGVHDAEGEVWLQTYPRVLGHTFKPVSFWYAERRDGSLAAIAVEVNNTFGERHCYLLQGPGLRCGQEVHAAKVFHVSPFCRVEGHYRFRFLRTRGDSAQGARCIARIDHDDRQGPLLQTSVCGRLEPLTAASARRALFGMPLMTLGVIVRIHWQALRLWAKRVPWFTRPQALAPR